MASRNQNLAKRAVRNRGKDELHNYMQAISKYKQLSKDEEIELGRKYKLTKDPKYAHKLVEANLRFVVKVAYRYSSRDNELLDLVQEGNRGLLRAVEKYDPERGWKVISYGIWWIKAYIRNYLINNRNLVKIGTTSSQRKIYSTLTTVRARIEAEFGECTSEQLAEELEVPVEDVITTEARLALHDLSLNIALTDAMGGESREEFIDLLKSPDLQPDEKTLDKIQAAEIQKSLKKGFHKLTKVEKLVLQRRFLNAESETLQMIADDLSVCRERIRQVQVSALSKLKQHFGHFQI